ncbi:unnamed protein product [Spirodela intermedia]|uniref:Uncharacterized protein n=1 Tax=Spirodela intermedia TaxID=51605 RepID=A0A7I8JNV6_SPIIN|nr:unnamed protein product [Spirodela intermedia]CAA6671253.1 unnamed protein product [Spirodela intermedia]
MSKFHSTIKKASKVILIFSKLVPIDAVTPRVVWRRLNSLESLPDGTVALKPTPKCNLPDAVSPPHPPLSLHVRQLLIDHCPTSRVDTEVVKCELEVWNIGLYFGLFANGQDKRPKGRNIRFKGLTSNSHKILRQGDTNPARVILSSVGSDNMQKFVLGPLAVSCNVGQEKSCSTYTEEAVWYEHGLAIAKIPVLGDVLSADNNGIGVAMDLKEVLCELRMLPLSLYRFTIMEERDGVGLNKLQLTTRMPMSFGRTEVLQKRISSVPNMTCSASSRAVAMEGWGGRQCMASGKYVSSPSPERSRILRWNSRDDSSKAPLNLECFMNLLKGARSASGAR